MESKNELKKIHIKNRTCYYFEDKRGGWNKRGGWQKQSN